MVFLSLIIPCYNEEQNLPLLVARCNQALAGRDLELIFVDNGSTDGSTKVLAELLQDHPFARSVRVPVNQGYGYGILAGLQAAKGRVLAWTHADMQTDPADVLAGIELFRSVPDPDSLFVKGRRYGRPLGDVFFSIGMGIFETLLLGRFMWDINAQPTMFGAGFFSKWSRPPHDFSLDLFAYYQATQAGLAVRRIPVYFGVRAHGVSHWNVNWKSKVKFIRRTVDFSFRLRRELRKP